MRKAAAIALIAVQLTWAVPALGQEVAAAPPDDEAAQAAWSLPSRKSGLIHTFASSSAAQRPRVTHVDAPRFDRAGANRPRASQQVQLNRRRTAKKVAITVTIIAAVAVVFWVTKKGPCQQCVVPAAGR